MRKLIVTGTTGFIGARFARKASELYEIHALVRGNAEEDRAMTQMGIRTHGIGESMESVLDAFMHIRPWAVLHIASKFCAQHSVEDIDGLIDSNVALGTRLLEGMRQSGCSRILHIGSSWQHYRNEDYDPVNLYSATKQAFKDIARFYAEAYGFTVLGLELFDTYGPGDTRKKLLHLLKESARGGERLELSPGEQMIDLLHVDDVVSGILAGLRRLESSGAFETFVLSSGERHSLRDLVEICKAVAGAPIRVAFGGRPYREREVMVPWERGIPLPGWEPRIPLRRGLEAFFKDSEESRPPAARGTFPPSPPDQIKGDQG